MEEMQRRLQEHLKVEEQMRREREARVAARASERPPMYAPAPIAAATPATAAATPTTTAASAPASVPESCNNDNNNNNGGRAGVASKNSAGLRADNKANGEYDDVDAHDESEDGGDDGGSDGDQDVEGYDSLYAVSDADHKQSTSSSSSSSPFSSLLPEDDDEKDDECVPRTREERLRCLSEDAQVSVHVSSWVTEATYQQLLKSSSSSSSPIYSTGTRRDAAFRDRHGVDGEGGDEDVVELSPEARVELQRKAALRKQLAPALMAVVAALRLERGDVLRRAAAVVDSFSVKSVLPALQSRHWSCIAAAIVLALAYSDGWKPSTRQQQTDKTTTAASPNTISSSSSSTAGGASAAAEKHWYPGPDSTLWKHWSSTRHVDFDHVRALAFLIMPD